MPNSDTLDVAGAESVAVLDHVSVLDQMGGEACDLPEHIRRIEPTHFELNFPIDEG